LRCLMVLCCAYVRCSKLRACAGAVQCDATEARDGTGDGALPCCDACDGASLCCNLCDVRDGCCDLCDVCDGASLCCDLCDVCAMVLRYAAIYAMCAMVFRYAAIYATLPSVRDFAPASGPVLMKPGARKSSSIGRRLWLLSQPPLLRRKGTVLVNLSLLASRIGSLGTGLDGGLVLSLVTALAFPLSIGESTFIGELSSFSGELASAVEERDAVIRGEVRRSRWTTCAPPPGNGSWGVTGCRALPTHRRAFHPNLRINLLYVGVPRATRVRRSTSRRVWYLRSWSIRLAIFTDAVELFVLPARVTFAIWCVPQKHLVRCR
jgi:hypothetical protein